MLIRCLGSLEAKRDSLASTAIFPVVYTILVKFRRIFDPLFEEQLYGRFEKVRA